MLKNPCFLGGDILLCYCHSTSLFLTSLLFICLLIPNPSQGCMLHGSSHCRWWFWLPFFHSPFSRRYPVTIWETPQIRFSAMCLELVCWPYCLLQAQWHDRSSYSWALGEKEKLEILLVLVGFLIAHMKTQLFQPLVKHLDKFQLLSSGGDFAHSKII